MRDAIKYLDQVSILGDLNEENVIKFLGIASHHMIDAFIQKLFDAKGKKHFDEVLQAIQDIHNQGIDLLQFTKQVLIYIDENLTNDIEKMSDIAQVFTDIISQSKRYPQPILLYKTALYHYVMGREVAAIKPTLQPSPTSLPPQPQTNNFTKNSSAPSATPNKQPAAPSHKPKATPTTNTNNVIPQGAVSSSRDGDLAQLAGDFIEAIDKASLKKMFHDQSKFTGITGNLIDMVVINPMAKMQVKKKETIEYLEQILSTVAGKKLHINFVFQTKEEFMSNQLLGEL